MGDAATDLGAALLRRMRETGTASTATGVVASTAPLTVTVGGTDMTMGRLASYSSPAVGDVVLILTSSTSRWTVLGKVVAS